MGDDTAAQRQSNSRDGSFLPTSEFLELLSFNFDEALIWLGDRRMMMVDVAFFAKLREQLIEAAGLEQTYRIMAKLGFESGLRDAQLVRERWPNWRGDRDRISTMLPHRFQGINQLRVVSRQMDDQGRVVSGEWQWRHSIEADAHITAYGRAPSPTCWMEVGYAVGYSYGVFDQMTLFREIGCRAMGNSVCTIVGRSAELSDDLEADLKNLEFLKPLIDDKRSKKGAAAPPTGAEEIPEVRTSARAPSRDEIVGRSPALTLTKGLLGSVAATDATVLISGESGVGKELFTRNLHKLSHRREAPLVSVNCAAVPETLIESELFGVERGAFTGATESRAGRFERAQGGTLFLDEIGTLNHAAQVKLLRVLQEKEIERIGGTKPIKLDLRIVAANNVSLRELVNRREFREDLFYRLNVFPIHVPPLRERRDDIPELMAYYLNTYNIAHGRAIERFTYDATKALLNYHYPGNIRELQNLIERAVILAEGDSIDVHHLFAYGESMSARSWSFDVDGRLVTRAQTESEARYIEECSNEFMALTRMSDSMSWPRFEDRLFASVALKALDDAGGNVAAASRQLGMQRHQLEYRLKKWNSAGVVDWGDETSATGDSEDGQE